MPEQFTSWGTKILPAFLSRFRTFCSVPQVLGGDGVREPGHLERHHGLQVGGKGLQCLDHHQGLQGQVLVTVDRLHLLREIRDRQDQNLGRDWQKLEGDRRTAFVRVERYYPDPCLLVDDVRRGSLPDAPPSLGERFLRCVLGTPRGTPTRIRKCTTPW